MDRLNFPANQLENRITFRIFRQFHNQIHSVNSKQFHKIKKKHTGDQFSGAPVINLFLQRVILQFKWLNHVFPIYHMFGSIKTERRQLPKFPDRKLKNLYTQHQNTSPGPVQQHGSMHNTKSYWFKHFEFELSFICDKKYLVCCDSYLAAKK